MPSDELEAVTQLFISNQQRVFRNKLLRVERYATLRGRKLKDLEHDVQVARENLPKIDECLDDRDLMRREPKTGASAEEWILIQAILQDKTLQAQSTEAEQQRLDEVSKLRLLRQKYEADIAWWEQIGGSDDPYDVLAPLPRLPQEIERKEQDILETMLRVPHRCSCRDVEQFRSRGKFLAEDEVRRWVTREVVEALFPIVRELCELFGDPARADTWKAKFESWQLSELQRFAAEAKIETVKQEAEAAAQEIARRKAEKAIAEALARQEVRPPEKPAIEASPPAEQTDQEKLAGADASDASSSAGLVADREAANVRKKPEHRAVFMMEIISENQEKSHTEFCKIADGKIEKMRKIGDREQSGPRPSWIAKAGEKKRTWEELLKDPATNQNVRNFLYDCERRLNLPSRRNLERKSSNQRRSA